MSAPATLRLDKWLWHARFAKTRGLAEELVVARRVRLNNQVITKTHALVRPGDVVTLTQPWRVRAIRVVQLGTRRGPAAEAEQLYEELTGLD